ncbi:uncharacterized protein LOC109134917 [Beta vulgaris subsp. vulgaris]|uniref:uncharacterized protein LOC109134917 n=1 Tax=Beta vulgaris subsp. vulgaris TaxID=3555 RepID=UPI000900E700|nr:uncharacterized protein LOC109134917 [Beta vulgaris subsp. vulgaris]
MDTGLPMPPSCNEVLFECCFEGSETRYALVRQLGDPGLQASIEKNCIYFGGVCQEEASQLAKRIQMPIGTLPFRYLGVPLASKKLNFSQCKPLIDKITARAQGWVAHLLTYAGRLQKFLWTGTVDTSSKAPVAWDFLQQPKTTGGLNVTNMVLWNKATILKLLWAMAFKQDKPWVRWENAYYIKRQSLENVTVSSNTSWILRKILEARELLVRTGGWETVSTQWKFSIKKTYKLLQEDYDIVVWKSKEVWCKVLRYLNTQPQVNAQIELELVIKRARSTKDRSKLFVMMYTEALYAIWLQRNAKVF